MTTCTVLDLRHEIVALSRQVETLRQERDEALACVQTHRRERDEARRQTTKATRRLSTVQRERDEALGKLAGLEQELAEAHNAQRDLHTDVELLREKLAARPEPVAIPSRHDLQVRFVSEHGALMSYNASKFAEDVLREYVGSRVSVPQGGQLQIEHEAMRKRWVEATDDRDQFRAELEKTRAELEKTRAERTVGVTELDVSGPPVAVTSIDVQHPPPESALAERVDRLERDNTLLWQFVERVTMIRADEAAWEALNARKAGG